MAINEIIATGSSFLTNKSRYKLIASFLLLVTINVHKFNILSSNGRATNKSKSDIVILLLYRASFLISLFISIASLFVLFVNSSITLNEAVIP